MRRLTRSDFRSFQRQSLHRPPPTPSLRLYPRCGPLARAIQGHTQESTGPRLPTPPRGRRKPVEVQRQSVQHPGQGACDREAAEDAAYGGRGGGGCYVGKT